MLRKEIFICSYCKKEYFFTEDECREHENICDKFTGEYTGIAKVDYEGYRENYIGDISVNDLWERLNGCEIKIKVVRKAV